jgi:pyruvate formate lyase activating enzyme
MPIKEALYYEKTDTQKVHCELCPKECIIAKDKTGFCRARKNINGKLYSLYFGETTSIALDPIEKKPIYHFHPGENILSLGTKGCNFACEFCQNWSISQNPDAITEETTSLEIIRKAKEVGSFGVAYTYNEPFIWFEFVLDTAKLAKGKNLANVLVTNGYVNPQPLEEILPYIDAMNIDLKSMDDSFYRDICKGTLEPVLYTIRRSHKSCHIELTNLVIPTLNDSDDNFIRLVDWVYENLSPEVPMHFSRYFPCYKMKIPPTPLETLNRAYQIAKKKLKYVYLGNV